GEARVILAPELRDDLEALRQPAGPLVCRPEVEPVRLVIAGEPAGADAEDEPAAAHLVDRRRHLREQGGGPVRVAGDEHADAETARLRRERRKERPALETRPVLVAEDRHEVVVDPRAVEAERLRLLPRRQDLLPAGVLVRRLDAEADVRLRG